MLWSTHIYEVKSLCQQLRAGFQTKEISLTGSWAVSSALSLYYKRLMPPAPLPQFQGPFSHASTAGSADKKRPPYKLCQLSRYLREKGLVLGGEEQCCHSESCESLVKTIWTLKKQGQIAFYWQKRRSSLSLESFGFLCPFALYYVSCPIS